MDFQRRSVAENLFFEVTEHVGDVFQRVPEATELHAYAQGAVPGVGMMRLQNGVDVVTFSLWDVCLFFD